MSTRRPRPSEIRRRRSRQIGNIPGAVAGTETVQSKTIESMEKDYSSATKKLSKGEQFKRTVVDMHKKNELGSFINKIISEFGVYFSIIAMLILMPAMPVIFYLTILYNVILLTWENFKNLDVSNITE